MEALVLSGLVMILNQMLNARDKEHHHQHSTTCSLAHETGAIHNIPKIAFSQYVFQKSGRLIEIEVVISNRRLIMIARSVSCSNMHNRMAYHTI